MKPLNLRLTKDKQCWAPHYDHVEEGLDLKAGTLVRIVTQEHVAWEDLLNPGGHNYYELEWEEAGKRRQAWCRTYDHQTRESFTEVVGGQAA